jgi:hypothetical protein
MINNAKYTNNIKKYNMNNINFIFKNPHYTSEILYFIISSREPDYYDFQYFNSLRLVNKNFSQLIPNNFLRRNFQFITNNDKIRSAILNMLISFPCSYTLDKNIFKIHSYILGLTGPLEMGPTGAIGLQGDKGTCCSGHDRYPNPDDVKKLLEKEKKKNEKYFRRQQRNQIKFQNSKRK